MDSAFHPLPAAMVLKKKPSKDEEAKRIAFWDGISTVVKITGILVWCFVLLLTLLELKRYFNFDLIPGYDSAIDDVYSSIRGAVPGSSW